MKQDIFFSFSSSSSSLLIYFSFSFSFILPFSSIYAYLFPSHFSSFPSYLHTQPLEDPIHLIRDPNHSQTHLFVWMSIQVLITVWTTFFFGPYFIPFPSPAAVSHYCFSPLDLKLTCSLRLIFYLD